MLTKDKITQCVRELAKQSNYQTIYSSEKLSLKLFKNDIDLTEIQYMFLDYLGMYHSLFMDIILGEIEDRVLENNIYEDAYLYWKRNKPLETNQQPMEKGDTVTSKWIFKGHNK